MMCILIGSRWVSFHFPPQLGYKDTFVAGLPCVIRAPTLEVCVFVNNLIDSSVCWAAEAYSC